MKIRLNLAVDGDNYDLTVEPYVWDVLSITPTTYDNIDGPTEEQGYKLLIPKRDKSYLLLKEHTKGIKGIVQVNDIPGMWEVIVDEWLWDNCLVEICA